jgi:hypothetical protein
MSYSRNVGPLRCVSGFSARRPTPSPPSTHRITLRGPVQAEMYLRAWTGPLSAIQHAQGGEGEDHHEENP